MAGAEANITKLAESAASFGFINIKPDPDGTLRHALLVIRYQDQDFFPSLDLEVVREKSGRPTLKLAGEAERIAEQIGVKHISLSITHTEEQALAQVIFEG